MRIFDSKNVIAILFFFLVLFPKGGFKIGPLPITWGYLFLGIFSLFKICLRSIRIQATRLEAACFLIPFLLISTATIFINGTTNVYFAGSLFIHFLILPIIFYLIFSDSIEKMDLNYFLKLLRNSIFFVACYGIILFFHRIFTGEFFEIPFLTTNFGDIGLLEEKCNLRAGIAKLISTYNNGNLYGICLLIALPLYQWSEPNGWKKSIVILSLLLTLSRTLWLGLIVNELLYGFLINRKKIKFILPPLLIICSLSLLLSILQIEWSFIWDKNLGGRADQLLVFSELSLLSNKPFREIPEIVYGGIVDSFGLLGLIAFLLAMIGPIFLSIRKKSNSIFATCIRCGLMNYNIISCSDGALLLIPVMAFYWFFASLLQSEASS